MRALAEYVMRGRTQAVLVATMATGTVFFSWLGAAVIALVTLRKGPAQGGFVLFWALLPALALLLWGDTSPMSTIVSVMLVAAVLWASMSWPLSLVAAVVTGLLTSLMLMTVGSEYLDQLLAMLTEMLLQMQQQATVAGQAQAELTMPSAMQVAGLLGLSNAFTVTMCLVLARWWQAALYNPGGFGVEFQQLRLPPVLTVMLLSLGIAVSSLGMEYRFWALIFAVPFIFSGFSLLHALAAAKKLSSNWLAMAYIAWLILDPVKVALLLLVVADSWLNFRSRFIKPQGEE